MGGAKALKGKAPIHYKALFLVGERADASKLECQVKRLSTMKKRHIIATKKLADLACMLEQVAALQALSDN